MPQEWKGGNDAASLHSWGKMIMGKAPVGESAMTQLPAPPGMKEGNEVMVEMKVKKTVIHVRLAVKY